MGHNNRTGEGDRLVASGMKLQGFVEAGVRPVRVWGFCLHVPSLMGLIKLNNCVFKFG